MPGRASRQVSYSRLPPFLLCRAAPRPQPAPALARSLTNDAPLCAVWYPQDILAGYACACVEPGSTVLKPVPVRYGPSLPSTKFYSVPAAVPWHVVSVDGGPTIYGVDTAPFPFLHADPPSPEKSGRDDEADAGGRAKRARGASDCGTGIITIPSQLPFMGLETAARDAIKLAKDLETAAREGQMDEGAWDADTHDAANDTHDAANDGRCMHLAPPWVRPVPYAGTM